MVETEFDGIPAYKIDTRDYDAACRAAKVCYGKGSRYLISSGDDIFIVFQRPENEDCIYVFECEDNLQTMLNMLQHLRDWGRDDL